MFRPALIRSHLAYPCSECRSQRDKFFKLGSLFQTSPRKFRIKTTEQTEWNISRKLLGSRSRVPVSRGFFLHLAEFLDAIRPGSVPNMSPRRQRNGRSIKTKMRDSICFPTRLVPGLMFWLSALFIANNAHAALGDTVAEYSFLASSLVMSPTQPLMYATIPFRQVCPHRLSLRGNFP